MVEKEIKVGEYDWLWKAIEGLMGKLDGKIEENKFDTAIWLVIGLINKIESKWFDCEINESLEALERIFDYDEQYEVE